jgi:hypothetical protein
MAGAVNTSYTFNGTDLITSAKMNNILQQSIMTTDAIIGSTLAISGNKLKVNTSGITSAELQTDSVTTNAIADSNVTTGKLADSAVTTLKIADSNVTTAKIADSNVTTAKIADAGVTAPKLSGAQTGTAPIYGFRAWAKLNPYVGASRSAAFKSGNYTRTVSNTSVTISNHGLKVNDKIRLDFTSGTATDGLYNVTSVTDANTFVVDHVGSSTSGIVTAEFIQIQGAGNVSSACYYDSGSNRIVLNFTTPMPNANYAVIANGQYYPLAFLGYTLEDTLGTTQLNTVYQAFVYQTEALRFLNVGILG